MSWYREAEGELTEVAAAVQSQRLLAIDRIRALVQGLVSSLRQDDQLVVEALSGPPGPTLITNLINVSILGTKVGIGLGYYGEELDRLALGGLVHDIGLFAVPASVIAKAGRLTTEERMLIEQHPNLGAQVIQRLGPEYHWLTQVVLQAHERVDGCGYPNQLKGRQIGEMAQILGVVDVFDALVSDRPYRRRLLPHEAVKELLVVERTAFPREILKALIEQLSVYPLGTRVRLSTGEVATVERVNSRYPLRPVVHIGGTSVADQATPPHIDLSLTPLVSIVEALDPPAVGRVTFAGKPPANDQSPAPVSTSDQFTALLESLDVIASAIQGVVDLRKKSIQEAEAPSPDAESGSREQTWTKSDLMLHKELVGLFALEAREWLAQLQTALKKLDAGTERAVRSKLHGVIRNGMTHLARSASTVQLSDIEGMARALLPALQDIDKAETEQTSDWLRTVQEGLEQIAAAVHRLSGTGDEAGAVEEVRDSAGEIPGPAGAMVGVTGGMPDSTGNMPDVTREMSDQTSEILDLIREVAGRDEEMPDLTEYVRAERVAESAPVPVVPVTLPQEPPVRVESSVPLLRALRDLQRVRARSVQPSRDVLEAVIERAEQEVGPREEQIAVEAVKRILRDLGRLDEEFLKEVHERVPAMTEQLRQLRQQGAQDFVTSSQLAPIASHVAALQELAKTIHAATITMFLQGVQSFLNAAAYRKVETLPQRLQAVEVRIQTLTPMAEQWVTLGRLEIASIEEILPHSTDPIKSLPSANPIPNR
ncbi:MAG: HD domain-containing protein [Nitrospira sp.]|nr:HD domain-containing protein [Nitrospira sp.]